MNTEPLSNMARKLTVALWLATSSVAPAQTAVEAWVLRYSHPADLVYVPQKVVTDNAGNVIVAGYTDDGITGADFLLIKYSGAGVPLWTNRYNGPGSSEDYPSAVAVDGSGNVFLTGWSYASDGYPDYATVAYSGAGVPLWTNRYNGPANSDDLATAVAVDGSGNVFVTGSSRGSSIGCAFGLCFPITDYATIAYSGAGVPLWTNRYSGGSAIAIAVDGSGNVFVTGSSATIAYSGLGVPLWTNIDSGAAIAVDGSGNVFVTGSSWNGTNLDYATVAYSGAGVPLWTNRYSGPTNYNDSAAAVAVDSSGNVFVTGFSHVSGIIICVDFPCPSSYDYATIAYSGAGVPLWTNRYDGPDAATALAVDGSGNVFVTASSATIAYSGVGAPLWTNSGGTAVAVDGSGNVFVTGSSGADYATVAYSGAGVPLWTNRYNGTGNRDDSPTAVAVDSSGNVFVTGYSASSNVNVFPYNYDYATIAYSGAGVPLWTNRYHGPTYGFDQARAVAVDGSGNVFVTGSSASIIVCSRFCFFITDYATIAYSGAGVPLWTNRYNGPGNDSDAAAAVAVDGSGNVFVTGYSWSGSSYDYATIAYSGAGVPLWTNRYTGGSATAIAVDGSGNVFVTGSSWNGTNLDYATVAYSGAGVPLWTNRYNGPGNSEDYASAVAVEGSGNVFVTGSSGADYATVAYSGAGLPLWTNRYNGPANSDDLATAVAVDGSGNVFVTGSSATIAYSGLGVPLWTNIGSGAAIAVDGSGNVFVTGSAYGSGGNLDYATVAYSGAGVPLWTNRYNGPANGDDKPQTKSCLAIGTDGALYVTGASDGNYGFGTTYDYATIKYVYSIPLHHQVVGNQLVLSWANAAFSLQSAPAVQGPYTDVTGATSPYSTAFLDAQHFFRLKAN